MSEYDAAELRIVANALFKRVYEFESKATYKRMRKLEAEKKQMKEDYEGAITDLQLANAKLEKEISRMQRELKLWKPVDMIASSSGGNTVTSMRLETMGEKYVGQVVTMDNCEFWKAHNTWISQLEGVTLESNGLSSIVDIRHYERWIGFSIQDAKGELFQRCFARKNDYGESLVDMKSGTRINLRGTVVPLEQAGWYGLVCDKIEIAATGD